MKYSEVHFYKTLYTKIPQNIELSQDLYKKVYKHLNLFRFLPGIKAMAVCNSVALQNPTTDSDIDLFFILDRQRFFSYRLILTLLFHLLGLRRYKNKIRTKFCLSFFITNNNVNLEGLLLENDVYLYFWMKTLKFFYFEDRVVQDFYITNKWYDGPVPALDKIYSKSFLVHSFEYFFSLNCFNFIEFLIKQCSLKKINYTNKILKNPSGVFISDDILKFHVKDTRAEIRDFYYYVNT